MSEMSPKLQALIEASSSPSSRKALASDLAVFSRWHGEGNPFPASDLSVAEFVAHMSSSRAVSTIIRYISSISQIHERSGWDNPTRSDVVKAALAGLRKTQGLRSRQAPALSGKQLVSILSSLPRRSWSGQRNRALFSIGWSCGLRCAELQALNISDLEFVWNDIPVLDRETSSPATIVKIRRSKTDTDGIGTAIGIPASPITKILVQWTGMLVELFKTNDGPLFPRFSAQKVELYFPKRGMRPRLSVRGISKTIRTVMEANNITGSVHSLRRGVITEAARLQVPEHVIQRHSRHASVKSLRGYIEAGTIFDDNPLPIVFDSLFGSNQDL